MAAAAVARPAKVATDTTPFVFVPVNYSSKPAPSVDTIHRTLIPQCVRLITDAYSQLGTLGSLRNKIDADLCMKSLGVRTPYPSLIDGRLHNYLLGYEEAVRFNSLLEKFQEEMQKAIDHIEKTADGTLQDREIARIALTDSSRATSLQKAADQFKTLNEETLKIKALRARLDDRLADFVKNRLHPLGYQERPDLFPYYLVGKPPIPPATALAPKAEEGKEGNAGPAAAAVAAAAAAAPSGNGGTATTRAKKHTPPSRS